MDTTSPRLVRSTPTPDLPNEYQLVHPLYTLGRVTERDIVVRDELVSSMHAEIIYSNERYFIVDKSRNGIWMNGHQIAPGHTIPLPHEAILGIGEDRADFQYLNAEQTTARSEQPISTQSVQTSVLFIRGGRVFLRGTPLKLTVQERSVFDCLYSSLDELIKSTELLNHVYGEHAQQHLYGSESLHKIINRLRGKLGDDEGKIIVNERGLGYRLCPPKA